MTDKLIEREAWQANSRRLNPQCGCEQRGSMLFSCQYHMGVDDAWDDAYAAGAEWMREQAVQENAKQLARFRDELSASRERERIAVLCLTRLLAMMAGDDPEFAQMIADCRDATRSGR